MAKPLLPFGSVEDARFSNVPSEMDAGDRSPLHSKCLGQAKKGRKLVPDPDDRQGYSFKMSIAATSQRWIEFFSTILGAVIALILIPHTSGVLLLFGAILVAFYRLLRSTR